jgi:glycosyltransferase involved in cell wall biosynthesis
MRILMTMFGWADSGGGTIFPRQIARALAARGHQVRVVHAAVPALPGHGAYAVRETEADGVQLVGIHNRPAVFLDAAAPARELHDPQVARIVRAQLREFAPDLVHCHNFLGLSAALADEIHAAGVPSCYSPYNFWAICPTLYLTLPDLAVCRGPADDGANCVRCVAGSESGAAYVARRDRLRESLLRGIDVCLPTSHSVRDVFLQQGYPSAWLQLLRSGSPAAEMLWRDVGRDRQPAPPRVVRFGFAGSVLPIKGVHLLVAAAQLLRGEFRVTVHGSGPSDYLAALRRLDRRGVVEFAGSYDANSIAARFRDLDVGVVPSVCLDQSPQVIDELQAARVPVLGARLGGIPDYLQGDAGALFAPGDVAALAGAMQPLVDEPRRVAAWQHRMQAPPSFTDYVGQLEAIYQERVEARQPAVLVPEVTSPSPRRLNLGCGGQHLAGWLNIDKFAAAKPDCVVDLEQLPWPFADDSADEVLLHHVLEHLGQDSDTFLGILRELYRVCAPGARVRIVVPHPRHQDYLQDPTHVRPIVPELFLHTSLAVNRQWQAQGLPGTPLASYLGIDFAIESVDQRLDPHWQRWLAADPTRASQIDAIARAQNNVVQEVEIVLRANKPAALLV